MIGVPFHFCNLISDKETDLTVFSKDLVKILISQSPQDQPQCSTNNGDHPRCHEQPPEQLHEPGDRAESARSDQRHQTDRAQKDDQRLTQGKQFHDEHTNNSFHGNTVNTKTAAEKAARSIRIKQPFPSAFHFPLTHLRAVPCVRDQRSGPRQPSGSDLRPWISSVPV